MNKFENIVRILWNKLRIMLVSADNMRSRKYAAVMSVRVKRPSYNRIE